MTPEVKLEIIGEIQRLRLGPTDRVLIKINDLHGQDIDLNVLAKTVSRALGIDETRILVHGDEIELSILEG